MKKLALAAALLATSTQAAACAWVLYLHRVDTNEFTANAAYESKGECDSFLNSRSAKLDDYQRKFLRFVCLPDTVRPRG